MRDEFLRVSGLYKTYRRGSEDVHALEDVSLVLARGELVGLVGPSGSGKTTLLNVLSGWETPERGEMIWTEDGARYDAADLKWDRVSLVPQSLGLVEELSVRENVELPARIAGLLDEEMAERVQELLDSMGLTDLAHRRPDETSLGEQQRSAVARALLLKPLVILADEPTGHQDAAWATSVFWALQGVAGEGTCCVVATHNREVTTHADRVVAMSDGRVEPFTQEELAPETLDDSIWAPPRHKRYYSPRR